VIDGQPARRTVISIDSEKTGMLVELPLLPQLGQHSTPNPPATWASCHPARQAVDLSRKAYQANPRGISSLRKRDGGTWLARDNRRDGGWWTGRPRSKVVRP
jgi:hypothetical protein